MISAAVGSKCEECSGEILDVGDELVCGTCGVTVGKEVVETRAGTRLQAIDFTGQALGGYLGPPEPGTREKASPAFASSPSSFRYLKLISDFSGREDSTVYGCAKLIERVVEKLSLPRMVLAQAVTIAKTLYETEGVRSATPSAVMSAYSIVTACNMLGVTSASISEVVEAHRLLGRRVKVSNLIRLSLISPYKTRPRRPEGYAGKIIGRLASMPGPAGAIRSEGMEPAAYFAKLRQAALAQLASVDEVERGGHSPCTLAATALYAGEFSMAKRELRRRVLTQRDLAEGAGVAEYTVRELYGRLFRR